MRTNDAYRDYQLIIEYRWGERTWGERKDNAGDSGVLIHAVGPDGNSYGAWMASIEVLIIEGGTGGFIAVKGHEVNGSPVASSLTAEVQDRGGPYPVWKKGGKKMTIPPGHIDWFGKDPKWQDRRDVRGPADVENPVGQWNRMEIIADGDRIVVQLNGINVNEAFACFPKEGKVAIQTELVEIEVRCWGAEASKKRRAARCSSRCRQSQCVRHCWRASYFRGIDGDTAWASSWLRGEL